MNVAYLEDDDLDIDSIESLLDHPSLAHNPGLLQIACKNLIKEVRRLKSIVKDKNGKESEQSKGGEEVQAQGE